LAGCEIVTIEKNFQATRPQRLHELSGSRRIAATVAEENVERFARDMKSPVDDPDRVLVRRGRTASPTSMKVNAQYHAAPSQQDTSGCLNYKRNQRKSAAAVRGPAEKLTI